MLADRGLSFTDEDDKIALLVWIGPQKKPITRQSDRRDQTSFDFNMIDVGEIIG